MSKALKRKSPTASPTRLAAPVCSALKRQILADVRDHGWLLADWIVCDTKHAKAVDELLEAKKLTEWGLFIFEGEMLVYFTLGREPMDDRLRATLNWCEGWPNAKGDSQSPAKNL